MTGGHVTTAEATAETVLLGPDQIRAAVPMIQAIAAVRAGFVELSRGDFEMPVRTVLGGGQFLVMSARHRPSATAMVKTLSLNVEREPAISGTVVWSERDRLPQLVADASTVTALRTGAATGVATDLLASPDASRCTLIGTGGQAADQIRAVHAVRPLTQLTVVGRNATKADRLLATLRAELPETSIGWSDDPAAAVQGAEIVCCATGAQQPLFALADLAERVHVNAIGSFRPSMRELPDELLIDGTVVVDDLAAVLEESGEIRHAIEAGALDSSSLIPLGTALTQGVPSTGRTSFKSVGVAMQDWAIARLLAQQFLG